MNRRKPPKVKGETFIKKVGELQSQLDQAVLYLMKAWVYLPVPSQFEGAEETAPMALRKEIRDWLKEQGLEE